MPAALCHLITYIAACTKTPERHGGLWPPGGAARLDRQQHDDAEVVVAALRGAGAQAQGRALRRPPGPASAAASGEMPAPGSVRRCPACVPGGTRSCAGPWIVATGAAPPRIASMYPTTTCIAKGDHYSDMLHIHNRAPTVLPAMAKTSTLPARRPVPRNLSPEAPILTRHEEAAFVVPAGRHHCHKCVKTSPHEKGRPCLARPCVAQKGTVL